MLSSKKATMVAIVAIALTVGAAGILPTIANATLYPIPIPDPVPIPAAARGPPDRVCHKLTSDDNPNNNPPPCLRRH